MLQSRQPLAKLNLGCGPVQPAGWTNVDGSNRTWLASRLPWLDWLLVRLRLLAPTEFGTQTVYAHLDRRFPWADNSVDMIYMGEVLEHFTKHEGEHVLTACYRVLRPGGVLRLRVPDNARFWENYLAAFARTRQAPRTEWNLKHTFWIEQFFRDICVRWRPLRFMGHFHKWMYDEISLILALEQVGFQEVHRMPYLMSRIPDIEAVEVRKDLIVEGIKP